MAANDKQGRSQSFRVASPHVRRICLWVLLVPFILAITLTPLLGVTGLASADVAASTLIAPGAAIGAVHLGMSVREVIAILGEPVVAQGAQLKFPRWGITVSFDEGIATRIYTKSPLFKTLQGAGVGVSSIKATKLVGDVNSVVTTRGSYRTVDYAFRGIGFVFRGDRAVAVFVKPPATLGPPNVLGSSRVGTAASTAQPGAAAGATPRGGSSGRGSATGGSVAGSSPSGTAGGRSRSSAAEGSSSPAASSTAAALPSQNQPVQPGAGNRSTSSGSASSGGLLPAASPTQNQPIQSVSVDSNGNLIVNGQPFLLIFGEYMSYLDWAGGGYTLAQADAKIQQMKSGGLNAVFGWHWDGIPEYGIAREAQALWDRQHLYVAGPATKDNELGLDVITTYGSRDANAAITQIVDRNKTSPNALMWWILPEIDVSGNGIPWDPTLYASAATVVRTQARSLVYATITADFIPPWTNSVDATLTQVPFFEIVMSDVPAGVAISALYQTGLTLGNAARAAGKQFVFGVSTTPLPELVTGSAVTRPTHLPTQTELDRFFLLQVAFNVRAFSVLWGPNSRDGTVGPGGPGDAGLPAGYLDVWNATINSVSKVKQLESVILDSQTWTSVTTTPAFAGPSGGPYNGIVARKKTVAGVTYVIVVNMNMTGDYSDTPVGNATIDVGFPIKSATRMFETGTVQFRGGVITDSFVPMGVHVYKVMQ